MTLAICLLMVCAVAFQVVTGWQHTLTYRSSALDMQASRRAYAASSISAALLGAAAVLMLIGALRLTVGVIEMGVSVAGVIAFAIAMAVTRMRRRGAIRAHERRGSAG